MPSDYDVIRQDNIRRRGEEFDDIGQFVAQQLYSDRTHFVYELLQNAEDALARRAASTQRSFPRRVTFILSPKCLEVSHFGQPFNHDDVRAICDILRGTKATDETQIGRFGIGFKSVYSFTNKPHIYSGNENFRIERFIRPYGIETISLKPDETRFVFPFDHDAITPQNAYTLISDRLRTLGPRTLLFLQHVDAIKYAMSTGQTGTYERKSRPEGNAQRVTVHSDVGGKREEESWLVFERDARVFGNQHARVAIAFLLGRDDRTGRDMIVPLKESRLSVFFPTDRETRLGFLMHGPFVTTPARDNIASVPENGKLMLELAALVVDALEHLKKLGMLTVAALNALPLDTEAFPVYSQFRPIYEEVRRVLRERALLPTASSIPGYISAKQAKLARGNELRQLISDEQLSQIYTSSTPFAWLSDDITYDRTPDLRKYLLSELDIQEIAPDIFAGQVNGPFLQQQSDEWLVRFYGFLQGQHALWRPSPPGPLRVKAIVRLENGQHVTPFQANGSASAYLPGPLPTSLPTVRAAVASQPIAREFLTNLGLSTPDMVDSFLNEVLPRYANPSTTISDTQHAIDVRDLVAALKSATTERRHHLIKTLSQNYFFWAVNPATEQRRRMPPTELFQRLPDLLLFFEGNPTAWFLDHRYAELANIFGDLGIANVPNFERRSEHGGVVIISDQRGYYERGLKGFDPDATIQGLEFALKHITYEKSLYLWNVLLPQHANYIRGATEQASTKSYSNAKPRRNRFSTFGRQLCEHCWLPARSGGFTRPANLALADLPDDFTQQIALAAALGMKSAEQANPLKALLGVDADQGDIEFIKKNWQRIQEMRRKSESNGEDDNEVENGSVFDYEAALSGAFSRAGREAAELGYASGNAVDPVNRRERTSEEIDTARRNEIARSLRFRQVARRAWEDKNNVVRSFLREQYNGCCQICDSSFIRRDGEPYFNGVYLVSRTQRRWIDRSGNVLCLCPTCCAKFLHGSVEADEILEQIMVWRAKKEGGTTVPTLQVALCGEPVVIRFTEKHMLDLQELLKAAAVLAPV